MATLTVQSPGNQSVSKSVVSITRSSSTATATVTAHGYVSGQNVTIAGANETDYNGTFVITVTTANAFTFTVANTPATPATGTITAAVIGHPLLYASAGASNDKFTNNGRTFMHVVNASGATINVTFAGPNACSFGVTGSIHNLVVPVPDSSDCMVGPFSKDIFNDGNSQVTVTYSDNTSVTVAAVAF